MGLEEEMRGIGVESRDNGKGSRLSTAGLIVSATSWVEAVVGDMTAAAKERSAKESRQSKSGREAAVKTGEETGRTRIERGTERLSAAIRDDDRNGKNGRPNGAPRTISVLNREQRKEIEQGSRAVRAEIERGPGNLAGAVTGAARPTVQFSSENVREERQSLHKSNLQSGSVLTPNRKGGMMAAGRKRRWNRWDKPSGDDGRMATRTFGALRDRLGERSFPAKRWEHRPDRGARHSEDDGRDGKEQREDVVQRTDTVEAKGGLPSQILSHRDHRAQEHRGGSHQVEEAKATDFTEDQGGKHIAEDWKVWESKSSRKRRLSKERRKLANSRMDKVEAKGDLPSHILRQ